MAYVPQHNYRVKDGLETGDPDKVIYGSDLQDDFEAIARDLSTLDADNVADQADLDKEIQDRKDGDSHLQTQINNLNNGADGNFVDAPNDGKLYGRQSSDWAEVPSGGVSDWVDIENKPTEFPPSAHTHEIAEVNGLQDALDNAGGVAYTLPVVLRSGDAQLPLTVDGKKLAVMTRGGELELPLAA
jgi:hypothetical protein